MWVEVPGPNTHLHVLSAETRAVTLTAPLGGHHLTTCCHPGTAPLIPSLQSPHAPRPPQTNTQERPAGSSARDGSHSGLALEGPALGRPVLPRGSSGDTDRGGGGGH